MLTTRILRIIPALALCLLGVPGLVAEDPATLPDLGTDPVSFIVEAGTEGGTIMMAVFGVFVVLFIVGLAMRKIKKIGQA